MSSNRDRKQEFVNVSRDRTREELIFAVLSLPVAVDERIRTLVDTINDLPDVYTCSSCGGHQDPGNRENPVPEGCFYIQFLVEPTENGFLSLGIIDRAARTVNTDDLMVKVMNCTDNPNLVMFTIVGKNWVDPDDLATEIKILCSAWRVSLKGVRAYKKQVRRKIAHDRIKELH
jgi:hypothetical protein